MQDTVRRVDGTKGPIDPARLSRMLANSSLSEVKEIKSFLDSKYNQAVNKRIRKLRGGKLLNATQERQNLRQAVGETSEEFDRGPTTKFADVGDVRPSTATGFGTGVSERLALSGFSDKESFEAGILNDPANTIKALQEAIDIEGTILKVTEDGKLIALIPKGRDEDGNISFEEVDNISDKIFQRLIPSPLDAQVDRLLQKPLEGRLALDGLTAAVDTIKAAFDRLPAGNKEGAFGAPGGFAIFANNFIDGIKGFIKNNTIPKNITFEGFSSDANIQKHLGPNIGQQAQEIRTSYAFLILKVASVSGIGEGRALSDKDLEFARGMMSSAGVRSFQASLNQVVRYRNTQDSALLAQIKFIRSRKIFEERPPKALPFPGITESPQGAAQQAPKQAGDALDRAIEEALGN